MKDWIITIFAAIGMTSVLVAVVFLCCFLSDEYQIYKINSFHKRIDLEKKAIQSGAAYYSTDGILIWKHESH